MAYNYVTNDDFGNNLDQEIHQGLITGVLPQPDVDFLNNGQSFVLRQVTTSGYQPHTRTAGWNAGTITDKKTPFTMGQDRDISFYVDVNDQSETGQELAAANVSGEFVRSQATPEIDAYRFSKMVAAAGAASHSVSEALTKDNVYTSLRNILKPLRKYGQSNTVVWMSSDAMDALEQSTEVTKTLVINSAVIGNIETRVANINGVQLIEVWDADRFKSAFTFANGFTPASGAVDINILAAVVPATIPVIKQQSVWLFAPNEVGQGDGWLYQNHLYHDFFIYPSKADGFGVSLVPAASQG
ncbi:MAG: hypothetical protein ABF913_04790 [Oenococcus sp.]|uniref:hypothetical protein n=1 Tax=Oenococcus sp. TaxID=1979414 RepID=UPI0039E95E42